MLYVCESGLIHREMKKKWFKKLLPTCNVLQTDYSLGHGTINQNTSDTIQFPELNVMTYVPRHVCQHNPIPIPMDNMSKNKSTTSMTQVACESTLHLGQQCT